jgi:hypothetical protein
MTKPKYLHPRSKIRTVRPDVNSIETTIPAKIAHAMRLQPGDSIEWIWITEGYQTYCKVVGLRKDVNS